MARPQTISDEEILDTARQCFLEHGPSVATEVIAERLGVSPQALYKRFQSKQNLMLQAVAPSATPSWIGLIDAGPDERAFTEQLEELLLELAGFFVDVARRMSVLRFGGIDPQSVFSQFDEAPPLRDIRVIAGWLERAHRRGMIRKADFRCTAMMILSSLHGPAMLKDMLGKHPTGHSIEEYVRHVADMLLEGLKELSNGDESV